MKLKGFIKNWLIHSAVAWVLVNVADIFSHILMTGGPIETDTFRFRFINHNINQPMIAEILAFCLAVELNYQYLFKRFRFSLVRFAAGTIGLGLLFTLLLIICLQHAIYVFTIADFLEVPVIYVMYAGFYIFLRNYFEGSKLRAQQQQQQTAAELNALKAQLNPHFFFNVLNTVYGTALQENAPKTADTIDRLSSLVRYVMEKTTSDVTTAGDDIKFINHYFQLQQQRLPVKNNIDITITTDCLSPTLSIPPLLFIPFIENAFKYGISIDKDCFIHLSLSINHQRIQMLLENSIITGSIIQPGEGTGIANAKKRLALLYPSTHTLDIKQDENTFSVKLTINL